ncbi:unnamed protein product [Calicophoron daubneyi]|uniref:Uncharacterized protein n=1 Tax=Calicophoron daubneyi TaxID=300641 RepID=A0AAV2TYX0_CALDB
MEELTHNPWIPSEDEHALQSKLVVNGHTLEAKTSKDDSVMEDSQEKEVVYVSEGNTESMIIMEDKPPSPLSVQQGGGISLLESPPFEADQDDNSSPDRVPVSQSDTTLSAVSGVNVDVEDSEVMKTCMTTATATTATTTWVSDANSGQSSSIEVQQKNTLLSKSPSWSGPNEETVTGISHTLSNQIGANGDGLPANQQPQQTRNGSMKKSIRELYGRPSWWGDDDDREQDTCSGPRLPASNRKEKEETSRMSHPAEELKAYPPNSSKQVMDSREDLSEQCVRPRAEAFVIDFGTGLATTDDNPPSVSGTLSECVPERLRRGFDERERLKREREKENQLRRQMSASAASKTPKPRVTSGTKPTPGNAKPTRHSVVTKTPITTTAASKSSAVRAATGASSKPVSRGGGLSCRPHSSAVGGKIKTALSAANTPRGSSTPCGGIRNLVPRCAPSSAEVTQAARRLLSSNQSSPFRRTMSAKGSYSVTPSLTNSPCTPKNIASATRAHISSYGPGMHVSGSPCSRTALAQRATTRKISGSTNASALSRQTAPALAGKGIISPVKSAIRRGVNTPLTSARGGTTVSRGSTVRRGTVTTSTTHNFMSATASSGAKRVVLRNNNNNNNPNQPNAEPLLNGRGRPSRGPVLGNSAKKPVTSTQLRRPPSSSRTVPVRLQRQLSETTSGSVDKRQTGSRGSLLRTSDLTASIMAAIESYEDPKDYLFYRMFQGHEQTEVGVDNDVFKLFAGETPSEALADVDKEVYETAGLGMRDAILTQKNANTLQTHQTAAELRAVTVAGSLLPISQSETVAQLASVTTVATGSTGSALVDSSPRTRQAYQHVQWNIQTHGRPATADTVCPKSERSSATPLEPLVSPFSPAMQRRQRRVDLKGLSLSERESLGDSMLVSTSVTSLTPSNAGTYIINPDDTMAAHGLLCKEDISKINQDATLQEIPEPESLTPRGSQTNLSGASDPFELTSKEHSATKGKSANDEALPARASGLHSDRSRPLSCLAIVRDREVDLSTSLNLPNSSLALHTTTASTSSLVNTCKNDRDLDRTEAPLLSVDGVNSSMIIGASVASLTPSCAGTYVLDVDETLAAQGIPPVVIQSRENLASLKSPQSTNHVRTQEAITPRRSSPYENREGLWDVLEAEECTEDFVLLGSTDVLGSFPTNAEKTNTAQINTASNFESRVNMEEINEDEGEEEDYKLLPNPSNASLIQFENTRTANQLELNERIDADNKGPVPSEGSNRTWLRLGKGVTRTSQGSATPSLAQNETDRTLVCESSTNPREGTDSKFEGSQSNQNAPNWSNRVTGTSVALRLPDRSPSSISSPSSSPSSTTNNVSKNRGREFENLTNEATSPPTGGDISGPLSYAPLTDIHNCYRALQESVNYLLQSQTGSLQTSQIDQSCNLVSSAQPGEENVAMPIRISCFSDRSAGLYKHSADVAPTTTDARLASPGAAIWPSDMSECLRHPLTSRRAHQDRRHNSTASLDTALQGSATVPAITPRSHDIHSVTVHPGSSSVPELASPVHSIPYPLGGSMYQGGTVRENQQVRAVCWAPSGGSLTRTCNDRPASLAFGPANPDPQRPIAKFAGRVSGENEYPVIDSRTFTRRKSSQTNTEIQAAGDHPAHFDADSYHAWIEGMTAISQGIETLAKTPIFQPINSKPNSRTKNEPVTCERILPLNPTTKESVEHVSDLPDSTTGPSLIEPVRSAFVTPLPQRSFAMINAPSDVQPPCPGCDYQSSTSPLPKIGKSCPNASPRTELSISEGSESTMYYSLMVNSIRQLSLKLRQCSDNLIQRINAEQVNNSASSRTPGSRLSRTSSTDSVPSSTKYALSDALSNMQAINEQLRIVDKLLFSTDSNDLNQANSSVEGRLRNFEKTNRNVFTFIPIEKSVAAEDDARPGQPPLASFKQTVSTNETSINNARWCGTNRQSSIKRQLSRRKSPVTNKQEWIYEQKAYKEEPEGKQITSEHFYQPKTTQLKNDNDEEEYY